MKKIYLFFIILIAILLSSCLTLPEPSEKNRNMLYASTKCFLTDTDKDEIEISVRNKIKVTITIINRTTNKNYTLESNTNGEIIEFRIPCGKYAMTNLTMEFEYNEHTWTFTANPKIDDISTQFEMQEGVTNLGIIKMQLDIENEEGFMTWQNTPDVARDTFSIRYPNSAWNDKIWTNSK